MDIKPDLEHSISIPSQNEQLNGLLFLPNGTKSLVLFVHGSGSSRFSRRNQMVAKALNEAGHGTLLFDLLTENEEIIDNMTRSLRFNIHFLASRLMDVTNWCSKKLDSYHLVYGYFGASTGGAAALMAASHLPIVKAIVSRGGRPDLAYDFLPLIQAPTLLIVGGDDDIVIELNRKALLKLTCPAELKIVLGATHLFEEPGKLEEVSSLAIAWFDKYLIERVLYD